jgi:hypothetical protein
VKDASSLKLKSVLPSITDALFSLLTMLEKQEDHEDCEQFVIDATDAFWELGLHPDGDASCEESQKLSVWFTSGPPRDPEVPPLILGSNIRPNMPLHPRHGLHNCS